MWKSTLERKRDQGEVQNGAASEREGERCIFEREGTRGRRCFIAVRGRSVVGRRVQGQRWASRGNRIMVALVVALDRGAQVGIGA
jgi:hypothetical protein